MNSENALIKVNMLSEFSICSPEGVCAISDQNNRSKKVLMLLEYILTNRQKEISQDEIIELLWPDDDTDEPANTLKTLLHRARSALDGLGCGSGKSMVICRRGSYCWNNSYPVVVDAEEFEKNCQAASAASDGEKLDYMLKAIELYRGDFLPKSAGELWVVPLSTYYHSLYITTVHSAIEILDAACRYDDIIAICQKAIAIDPYDEGLHLSMIQALIQNGMRQAAQNHYNQVTELFLSKFGITPSPELTALYKEIIRTNKSTEVNLHVIQDELREAEASQGAFSCEYEIFKDIYRLQARAAFRTGQVVQIALITVLDTKGKTLTQKQLNVTMERLREIIAESLRNSDVYTRYSVSQYLMMLPSATLEDGDRVLQRISRNFRREYSHMNVLLHYTLLPIKPV